MNTRVRTRAAFTAYRQRVIRDARCRPAANWLTGVPHRARQGDDQELAASNPSTAVLERDYLSHAGRENGYLRATWEQMRHARIPNRRIAQAIAEAEALGLVAVTHRGSYRGGARKDPNLYPAYLSAVQAGDRGPAGSVQQPDR